MHVQFYSLNESGEGGPHGSLSQSFEKRFAPALSCSPKGLIIVVHCHGARASTAPVYEGARASSLSLLTAHTALFNGVR